MIIHSSISMLERCLTRADYTLHEYAENTENSENALEVLKNQACLKSVSSDILEIQEG